jgi:threonine synthase
MNYSQVPAKATIEKTIAALKTNGIEAILVPNGKVAKAKALELIPLGAEVMTMTSVTVDTIGLAKEINESGKYSSVRKKLMAMDRKTQGLEMQKQGAAPEWAVGSVHAVTEDGTVMIASASGSQLSAYAGGAPHVLWIAGAQKLVKDRAEGFKRIYEYTFPLENARAKKAYGVNSAVNKILIINKEFQASRITMLIINEMIGF